MSGDQDNAPRDSRLEAFLRQASAIIAAEKGLNNAAKAKLDDLAQRLHLPDELFEAGLKKLQHSNSPVGNLTDYEQGFLKFLIHEFSKKPKGTVLSISIEQKAIAHAKDRFGIAAHRAEQLIDWQAAKSGIGRLSRTDARDFGQQMILDRVGSKTVLDEETEQHVYRIGRRWGVEVREVQDLIIGRMEENERAYRKERRRPVILGAATMVCVALIALGGWWLYEKRDSIFGKRAAKKDSNPAEVSIAEKHPETPPVEIKSKRELAFPELAASLALGRFSNRTDAIAAATEKILKSRPDNARVLALQAWFFQEEDLALVGRFVQTLDNAMKSEPTSNRDRALEVPYQAAFLAKSISESTNGSASPDRKQMLKERLDRQTEQGDDLESSIASRQWNQLIRNSWQQPGRSSILVQPLMELTEPKLSQQALIQFVGRCVRTIVLADKNQWENMRQAVRFAIESSDEVQRMEWIDIWLDNFDPESAFRSFTGPVLIADAKTNITSREFESRLRSERSQWRNRRFRPALLRHEKINESIKQLMPRFANEMQTQATPDLVFQTAATANLCLEAISITESGLAGDDSAWSDVDAQLARLDTRLRDFIFLDEQASGESTLSSAGFDTTLRDRTLIAFADRSEANRAKRIAAIERLPALANKFESIPQPMASELATYLLSPIEENEWIQMQRVVPELAKWPRVVLAIADQLPESTASIDQVMTMYSVLTGSPWDSSVESEWRDAMSLGVLKLANDLLLADEVVDPNSSASDWVRLEKFLQSSYWQRSRLLGAEPARGSRSVVENAKQCVRSNARKSEVADRAIGLIDAQTSNDLEKIASLNQLLVTEKPEFVRKNSATAGQRLLQSEMALLEQWNRQRKQQLKELVDED